MMMDWQPISSFNVLYEDSEFLFWLDNADDLINPKKLTPKQSFFTGKFRCWSSVNKATHWMPLPKPPLDTQ